MNVILPSQTHVQYHSLSIYCRSQVIWVTGWKKQHLHPVEYDMRCKRNSGRKPDLLSLDSIRCDVMDWFHMKTQFHSLPIFIEHQCDSLEMRKCSITNFLLVMEQDVMRLPSRKHCIVTHILLVMGWDMMRLLVANTVVSLTDCLYGVRCIKTATSGKTAVHSPTIGYRIRCISISWHSITHMLS